MEYGDSFQSHEHQLPIILWVRIDGLNELYDCLPQAKHNLGVMYEYGRGVAQDHKEAVKWYMGPEVSAAYDTAVAAGAERPAGRPAVKIATQAALIKTTT